MKEKMRHMLVMVLAFIVLTLSVVETTVPLTVQAASKTTTVNKSITLTTSKTIKTKYTIKSVKSSKSSILLAKKISSKKFKVTSRYKYGSAVVTVKFKNGKTTKYKYSVGKYSLKKGSKKTITAKYTIKSVKSSKPKIALVKKTSSKKFRVTAKKAGTATITVRFKNGKKAVYYFKVTGSSGGSGNSNTNKDEVSLSKTSLKMTEGDSATLTLSIPSSYAAGGMILWNSDNTAVATVPTVPFMNEKEQEKVTVKAVGAGTATITAFCILSNHYEPVKVSCRVTVSESKKSASVSGFSVLLFSESNKDTFKVETNGYCVYNADGTSSYKIYFFCDGSEYWITNNVTFEIEDVTPTAHAKMFSDMGIPYRKPVLKVDSAASHLRKYDTVAVLEPFTSAGPGKNSAKATGGKILTIHAGMSTRAVKVVAKQGQKVLDYIYVVNTGIDQKGNSSEKDTELYTAVLQKVEKALWKPGMTNAEKLQAIANYINKTNHYPGSDTTSKRYNPTFWKNWSVDDKFLLSSDATLNSIMMFQGGMCDCWAAGTVMKIAVEDLRIPKLKDQTEKGEGVWLGMGANSSTPVNPTHMTMFYRSPEGTEYAFDVQGMNHEGTSQKVTCEAHGCRGQLISLK